MINRKEQDITEFEKIDQIIDKINSLEIKENTFRGCSSLGKVVFPETLTSISRNAFNGCTNLTQIYLPSAVGSIGSGAFVGTNLEVIYWNWTSSGAPTLADENVLGAVKTIYMPQAFIDNIDRYSSYWKALKNIIVAWDFEKNPVPIK